MSTIHISIGNSDDKLPQGHWALYCADVRDLLDRLREDNAAKIHGVWYSASDSPFQNMCVCLEMDPSDDAAVLLRNSLSFLAVRYRQDSIAWTVGEPEFIGPAPSVPRAAP